MFIASGGIFCVMIMTFLFVVISTSLYVILVDWLLDWLLDVTYNLAMRWFDSGIVCLLVCVECFAAQAPVVGKVMRELGMANCAENNVKSELTVGG